MNQEIAEALINDEDNDETEFFEIVKRKEIIEQRRWHIDYEIVYKDTRNDTYWVIWWCRGATEQQDDGPEDITFEQVKPVQKTITVYEPLA